MKKSNMQNTNKIPTHLTLGNHPLRMVASLPKCTQGFLHVLR